MAVFPLGKLVELFSTFSPLATEIFKTFFYDCYFQFWLTNLHSKRHKEKHTGQDIYRSDALPAVQPHQMLIYW